MSVEKLVEHFSALEDPRCAGKIDHRLIDILVIAVCAVIACAESWDDIALSGLITAVVRGGLPVAPLHAFRASTPGTGKSLLVDVAATIATGRPCPVIAAGKDAEETEKRLGALLRDGVPIISIDNVEGELGGDMLCQVTERPLVRVRILGL